MTQKCNCYGSGDKHTQTVAAVLERPRYSPGLILEDSDLTSAVDYTRSLSRLLVRNLFGCGVICGLVVSVKKECGLAVTVAPGLALDGCGDPVEVPGPVTITLDTAEVEKLENLPQGKAEFWVVLCGREKMCLPRPLVCDSDDFDGVTQTTRIRALAEVSLTDKRPECACGCQAPPRPDDVPPPPPNPALPAGDHADEREADCHYHHANRIECAPDCGCGTACACGCCVLLARVAYVLKDGKPSWQAMNRGVRRLIRVAMLPDPADRPPGWKSSALPVDFDWADIEHSEREAAMNAFNRKRVAGGAITQDMVVKMAKWTYDQRALRQAGTGTGTEAGGGVAAGAEVEAGTTRIAADAGESGTVSTEGRGVTGKKTLTRRRAAKPAKGSGGS